MHTATTRFFFLVCVLSLGVLSNVAPSHAQSSPFTDCPTNPNANNATVQFVDNVAVEFPDGSTSFSTGDEIAFFTDDGVCAGLTAWDENDADSRALSISGSPSGIEPSEVDGYADGEALRLSVWQQSTDRRFDVAPSELGYEPCDGTAPLCRDDGLYASNVIFTVVEVGSGVLPVELSSFSLRLRNDQVYAFWRTLSETNNSGFTIQHRRNAAGGWQSLGFVTGRGTTTTPRNYSFTTNRLTYGLHQFRLLQHDYDGTTTEIATEQIMHNLTETPLVLSIVPQPVRSQATLTLTTASSSHIRIELFDLLGRHVRLLHDGPLSPSTPHTISLTTNGLSPGQYIVRVQSGSDRLTRRFVVVR